MQQASVGKAPVQIGFFLAPKFSLVAFMSAIEPLRLANYISGETLYSWELFSEDGAPVTSSSGIRIEVNRAIADVDYYPTLFVCGGIDIQRFDSTRTLGWLRRMVRRGCDLGALCTGSYVLAKAGLLDGYRCTIHWENLPAFTEEFPDLEVSTELYEIDRNRMTCSGGIAALDMMLYLIALQYGRDIAIAVSDELIYDHIRDRHDQQRMALRLRIRGSHPKLLDVISHMEANLEQPLSQGDLARAVNLSTRQLERLFRKYLGRTPTQFYLELRLNRARLFLQQTSISVLSVALACGFVSASHFSKCYREHFGRTPREERRVPVLEN